MTPEPTPLLDRQRELDLITEALKASAGGNGSLLVVTGGLGTGKTALLRAVRTPAERLGTHVLGASAALMEQDFAFGVVGQLLEPLLPGTSLEPDACDPAATTGPEPHGELLALVAERAARTPLLLLVDDLQWADAPSLRWLGYLAKRIARLCVTVIVSLREGDPHAEEPRVHEITDRAGHVLRPGPLSPQSTAELVAARFGHPADPARVTACHEAGAGNPMFLTATLDALAAADLPDAGHADAPHTTALPSLRERLQAALRSQPAPVQAMAKALAVLTAPAAPELAGRLAGLDETGRDSAVRALCRLGLLTADPEPRFVHRAVRDAVEDAMTPAEHEDGHIYAALLLHTSGHPAEQAATQLLEAPSCQDSWATEVLRTAATAALRRGAPEDAARYLRRALLGSRPAGPDRAALLVDLATVERAFDPPAAIRHIGQALLLIPSPAQRAIAAARIPPSLLGGCPPPSVEAISKVADELGPPELIVGQDRELALRLEARLRHVAVAGPGQLLTCADRLRSLGPTPPLGTAAERELVTVLLHGATMSQGMSAAEVTPLAHRVLQYEPASPDHTYTALPLLTHILIAADSVETITPWLRTAQERARRENATAPEAVISTQLTQVLLAQGRLEEARAQAAEALALGVADWATLQSLIGVVLVAIESRDAELTRRLLAYRREGVHQGHQPSSLQLIRGSAAAAAGDLPTALEYFLDWGRAAERADWRNPAVFPWRAWAAGLHYRMGHAVRAQTLIEEECARARAWGTPVAIGRAQRMKGAVTEGEPGIALLRESLDTLEGAVNGMERARTSVLLGRRLRAADRAEEAERHLRRGREQALACGVPWLAERAARELRAMARGVSSLAVESLTRAERTVAGLAAQGVSNRDIAERLDVSSRAVEKHLTHAYRKLSVSGRTELAALSHLLPGGTTGGSGRTAPDRTEPKHRRNQR
ncbi:AAA family ATPase [Streptomyces sp. ISL-11]|uniref:ATP-binding protein n=1 Tax=Streptomyces sp. ISL-11 TaxID=2819174 RepID=UPI001BEBC4A3|nr:LuxR family transcriptional regulator [Streptomyces sp. ISL-11]MBT2386778.1 AAA family ATPase [Streptomyces sp. ISL-11]